MVAAHRRMSNALLETVLETWRQDFSDLPDAAGLTRLVTRLTVAAVLGGVLGFEREVQGKDAGLRTHMLICVGAALFVLVPQQAGIEGHGVARIIEGVIAGVGFIGGGAILKLSAERRIEGLTTAAGIWLTAGIGIAVGLGRATSAVVGTLLALIVLAALTAASRWIARGARREPPRDA
jgi:putative Mg2+ transporter-C (MgtC) family protein